MHGPSRVQARNEADTHCKAGAQLGIIQSHTSYHKQARNEADTHYKAGTQLGLILHHIRAITCKQGMRLIRIARQVHSFRNRAAEGLTIQACVQLDVLTYISSHTRAGLVTTVVLHGWSSKVPRRQCSFLIEFLTKCVTTGEQFDIRQLTWTASVVSIRPANSNQENKQEWLSRAWLSWA